MPLPLNKKINIFEAIPKSPTAFVYENLSTFCTLRRVDTYIWSFDKRLGKIYSYFSNVIDSVNIENGLISKDFICQKDQRNVIPSEVFRCLITSAFLEKILYNILRVHLHIKRIKRKISLKLISWTWPVSIFGTIRVICKIVRKHWPKLLTREEVMFNIHDNTAFNTWVHSYSLTCHWLFKSKWSITIPHFNFSGVYLWRRSN